MIGRSIKDEIPNNSFRQKEYEIRCTRSVLIISPESWQSNSVSKHHYARALARQGFNTYFLNPPVDFVEGFRVDVIGESGCLFEVNAPLVAKGLRFYPGWLRRSLEAVWLKRFEMYIGIKIDAVWLFENSRFYDMSFAGDRLKIYHQVDLNQDFHVSTAAKTADICFSTTDFICQKLQNYNSKVYKVHHGVSVVSEAAELPVGLELNFRTAKAHVGYIGNLDICYLDVPLLAKLVRNFPEVVFHFVGNYKQDGLLRMACCNAKNVVWWGRVESRLIPVIVKRCDVLLVTYLAETYREQLASPHKMMEYLASGKAIVATYTDEYKDKRHLVEMVDQYNSEFEKIFRRVVENLDEYNSAEKQALRMEYALDHSYDRQLDKIMKLLKEHGLDEKL